MFRLLHIHLFSTVSILQDFGKYWVNALKEVLILCFRAS